MIFWYLNQYIVKDKLKFKIVKNYKTYKNWNLIDTYILDKNKFVSREIYLKRIKSVPKQSMFKKLLAFFNKL